MGDYRVKVKPLSRRPMLHLVMLHSKAALVGKTKEKVFLPWSIFGEALGGGGPTKLEIYWRVIAMSRCSMMMPIKSSQLLVQINIIESPLFNWMFVFETAVCVITAYSSEAGEEKEMIRNLWFLSFYICIIAVIIAHSSSSFTTPTHTCPRSTVFDRTHYLAEERDTGYR